MAEAHDFLCGAEVSGVGVKVEEFGHPKTMEETIAGAKSRAQQAFKDCKYSFGIESGLMEAGGTKSGYMEFTACAIYDGKNYHVGFSPAFEWPREVTKMILNGLDGSQAWKKAGFTENEKIGEAEGAVHHLTGGKMNRTELSEQAAMMALVHLQHPEHY